MAENSGIFSLVVAMVVVAGVIILGNILYNRQKDKIEGKCKKNSCSEPKPTSLGEVLKNTEACNKSTCESAKKEVVVEKPVTVKKPVKKATPAKKTVAKKDVKTTTASKTKKKSTTTTKTASKTTSKSKKK